MLSVEQPRYEVKITCAPHLFSQIHAWVRLHPAHWRVAYPPRQVNNLYFDTYDYASLNDNLEGSSTRRKLRLRWYGPRLGTIAEARLELKCKEGQVGWKEVWPLDLSSCQKVPVLSLSRQPWPELDQIIRPTVDARARLWMDRFPYPVLINHYRRAYYATPDEKVRLTVDSELRAYNQRFSAYPNLRHPAPLVDRVVVELKADRQHYPRLVNLLSNFPARVDRHSKYVRGTLAASDFGRVRP